MKQRTSLTDLLVLAVLLVPISIASAQTACNVVYTISPQSSSQFGATIGIKNGGSSTLSGWSLTWTFANGQTIASSWNGAASQSGANVTVREQTGQAWEDIPPGGTYTGFGFNGTWNGATNAVPTHFAVNGVACNGATATPGFMLTPSLSQISVAPGGTATDTVTVTDTGGFNGTVTLTASSSSSGLTASVNGNTITIVASSTATGMATISVTGTSGSLIETTTIPVTVTTTPVVLAPGDHNETITSGGLSRTFIVHIPTGFTGKTPTPAIIDFHPLGGTGSQQESSSGWKAKCDSVGCIVVYPNSSATQASDNSWNAGYCCTNAQQHKVNDVQFGRDIVTWLKANTNLDATRVYASGGSNGGGMAYRMAAEASDVIAAVAPVDFRCVTGTDPLANATAVSPSNSTACTRSNLNRPISVVAWDEGQDNSVVPFNGGQTPSIKTDCPPNESCVGIGFPSARVNAQTWADFNGCTGTPTTDPGNSLCQTWTSCEANTTVSLCTNPSATHLSVYGSKSANFTGVTWDRLSAQKLPR